MNEINTTALAADVLLRFIFYTGLTAGIYAAAFGAVYVGCSLLLGRKR